MTPETLRPSDLQRSPEIEIPQPIPDAFIVPGKTIFRRDLSGHLDPLTKLNLLAAGDLFTEGRVKNLILSTARLERSVGLWEARAMKNFLKKRFPDIPDSAIILAGRSKSLTGSINGIRRIIKNRGFKMVGFLSIKPVIRTSEVLLRAYMAGELLKGFYVIASEQVVSRRTKNPDLFLKDFAKTRAFGDEEIKRAYRTGEIIPFRYLEFKN